MRVLPPHLSLLTPGDDVAEGDRELVRVGGLCVWGGASACGKLMGDISGLCAPAIRCHSVQAARGFESDYQTPVQYPDHV